jgi:serine kinase of HPr protein (carbohydrate metabolism regulator)
MGFIDIRRLYGENAVAEHAAIDLIVELISTEDQLSDEMVFGPREMKLLDVNVPGYVWSIEGNRDIALLIETAALAFRDPQSLITAEHLRLNAE